MKITLLLMRKTEVRSPGLLMPFNRPTSIKMVIFPDIFQF